MRDLAPAMARGGSAATTVASTAHLAARAGIRVFATGGLGGVHREARESWDESADLSTLAATGITVVCAGVKSILDVGATLERLETLNVVRARLRHRPLPGLLPRRLRLPGALARRLARGGRRGDARSRPSSASSDRAIVVANPLPEAEQVDPALHDRVLAEALAAAAAQGVRGGATTPFLLDRFHRETAGATLEANIALVRRNAVLAARIARAAA